MEGNMENETHEQPKQTSSMMEEPRYDAETETLAITFKKGGTYTYANFPPEKFAEFHAAPSWGKWYHANRPMFENAAPAQQVSEGDELKVAS